MNTLVINAEDLGCTESIKFAIKEAHLPRYLSHVSLKANTAYIQHAVDEVLPVCPQLNIGVHINLTCAKTLTGKSKIVPYGSFKGSFVSWLLMKKNKKILNLIEIGAQIVKVKSVSPNISHIDGHEHIHLIPSINLIVKKLADKYEIPSVREINENFFESLRYNFKTTPLVNVVKLGLLKFLSLFNRNSRKEKFYNILHTCRIEKRNLFPYLDHLKGETVEVMLHPSLGFSEKGTKDLNERFITFFKSLYRKQEYDLCFNPQFKKYEY